MAVINTNITSLIGQQNLNKSQSSLQTAMERLSSGSRINSAKDDAAGQAIANRMSSQITGLTQAQRNANDGISVAQTTEGALNQVNDNLQRIRELTVQAQNGTNSADDLESIQNEIGQRLDEINRISDETEFNGVKVLQSDNSLTIQVGANDGQSISIDLKQINAKTLGLDGFNVDGTGETQNKSATITDLLANDAKLTDQDNVYNVQTKHEAASLDDVMGQLSNGNTVTIDSDTTDTTSGTTYTFNAASDNFSYEATNDGSDASSFITEQKMLPTTGTKSGTYTNADGYSASFETDATGNLTIDGKQAYWTENGELTTNNTSGNETNKATLESMVSIVSGNDAAGVITDETDSAAVTASVTAINGRSFSLDGVEYNGAAAANDDGDAVVTGLSYQATATKEDVATKVDNNTGTNALTTVKLGSGITEADVTFANGSTDSAETYVDDSGELTTVEAYNTQYKVNQDTGEVTVVGNADTVNDESGNAITGGSDVSGTKYSAQSDASVYLSSDGKLTTAETSAGDKTADPLTALDAALKTVDSLRSDLGAIQNRFDSAIDNLSTTNTNLSAARSRIEDADYAVEVSNMTRAQILQQAGTSVLAQANQVPQGVLSLLG